MISEKIKLYIQDIMESNNLDCDVLAISCSRKDDKYKGVASYKHNNKLTTEQFEFDRIIIDVPPSKLTTPELIASYSGDSITFNEVNGALSYTLKTVSNPFSSEPETEEVTYDNINDIISRTNVGNTLYSVRANGDGIIYTNSDFSNQMYKPGTPQMRGGEITDVDTYTVNLKRYTNPVLSYIVAYKVEDDVLTPINEYRGEDLTISIDLNVYSVGRNSFRIQEIPFNTDSTLKSTPINFSFDLNGGA